LRQPERTSLEKRRIKDPFEMMGDAGFDSSRKYRYALIRYWAPGPPLLFIGLNPSTADEFKLDQTVRKCCVFARNLGFPGLLMGNVYSYRATDPKDLFKVENRVSPVENPSQNDKALIKMHSDAGMTIAGWGSKIEDDRAKTVLENLKFKPLYCLGKNKDGNPKHPLYIPYGTEPVLYK
jgi:hypothetical protein